MNVEMMAVKDIKPFERNAKKHDETQIKNVMESIKQFGFAQPLAVDENNVLIIGHCRLLAAKRLKLKEVPVVRMDELTQEQVDKLRLLDNKLNESEWDFELLAEDIPTLDFSDFDIDWGLPTDDEESNETDASRKLSDRFLIPPFDIFNARGGEWNERKRYWNSIIKDKAQARADASCNMSDTEKYGKAFTSDVSILDPVLSEIVCKWFAPNNCSCFDCFAGDTVFGYVSAYLGNTFTGIELRQEQADFNNNATKGLNARYICDDGRNVLNHIKEESQDLLFSCPPYFDLEVYSDNENDASNQDTYEDFYDILDTAFSNAIKALKENRFAVIVVGDIRDKKTGAYYNFPNDIINTFRKNGMILYNNIKILTPIGTAQIRAGKYMQYRKTAHVYQDVLVFYKGNPKEIKSIFKEVEVADVSADME
jgi:hypothetical protein